MAIHPVQWLQSTQNGGPSDYDIFGTTGDDEKLLDDFIVGWLPDFATELHFTDIQTGRYRICVYAYRPTDNIPEDWRGGTYVNYPWVGQNIGGEWTGGLEEGVTHAEYEVDVLMDSLTIGAVSGMAFRYPTIYYWFNGVQLELLESYTPATLTAFTIDTGTLLFGGLEDMREPTNDVVATRSGFGRTLVDLHLMQMTITAHSDVELPETMDMIIDSGISEDSGLARILLQNWNSENLDQVGSYSINTQEVPVRIEDIPAADYVNSRGTIKTVIKHSVFVPFFAFTFESYIDHVAITIQ